MSKNPRPQLAELGDQIADWRRAKGFTQAQLESIAGLAHNALSRIENNQVSPRLTTIERIAAALGLSIEELQFRKPREVPTEVREESAEYLVNRLSVLDEKRRGSILKAFHTLLDQVETD
jgi:transcriptional regulator with XRE-family HTH domain